MAHNPYHPAATGTQPTGLLTPDAEQEETGYWGETAGNVVGSAKGLLGDMWQMVRHPWETTKGLASVGHSLINLARPGEQGNEDIARAVGEYFAERYGGLDNLAETFKNDPVGLAADVALLVGGVGGAVAKAGGKTGQVASQVSRVARTLDPSEAVIRGTAGATRLAGKGVAAGWNRGGETLAHVVGVGTGTGHLALQAAYQAGRAGAESMKNLVDAMRKRKPQTEIDAEIISRANKSIRDMGEARREAYRSGMSGLDNAVVDVQPIRAHITGMYDEWRVGPERKLNEGNASVVRLRQIEKMVKEFVERTGGQHTSYDLDILKKDIWDLKGAADTAAGRSANRATDEVYHMIRDEIIRVDPQYKAIMEGWEATTEFITELTKELSLRKTNTQQQALRKLIQSLRDGVNTNFGGRAEMVHGLDPQLTNLIGGRMLSQPVATGMARYLPGPAVGYGAGAATFAGGVPAGVGVLGATSPRLMGEAALAAGRFARRAQPVTAPVAAAARTVGPWTATGAGMGAQATRVARPLVGAMEHAQVIEGGPSTVTVPGPSEEERARMEETRNMTPEERKKLLEERYGSPSP